jgi:xanthine/CO dehydrogenase XdhC/CoxF family maturation factor/CTP:molybdopterin cytidylyltransferase MocA
MNNIYLQLIEEPKKNDSLVLGTLVKTLGSTPQIPGASAIFNENGLMFGTLGGGILEAETLKRATDSIKSGNNVFEEFSLNADINEKSGAICGGTATFLLDANPKQFLPIFLQIKNSLENRIPGILITLIKTINRKYCFLSRFWFEKNQQIPSDFQKKYGFGKNEIANILSSRNSQILKAEDSEKDGVDTYIFVEPVNPKPELVIIGAGHIGQALCHLGTSIDFDITVLDSRSDLATKERFPDAFRIINEDIKKGFKKINISENTYIVIVTQGHRDDAVALECCIKSNAAYIGMIGSKRKTDLMRGKIIHDKIANKEELDKIYAPIGLNIHSKTVNEIAVSIAAQLIDIRYLNHHKKYDPIIHCIVLAAGESKRMKKQKMLLPYNQKTIIETVIEKAKQSKANETWVVLGSNKEIIKSRIDYLKVNFAENNRFTEGMLSSVQCGFNAISTDVNAIIILLGDQPMLNSDTIDLLIVNYRETGLGIIIPRYNGKRGHPILIDLKYRKEINNLNPEIGLRELMQKYSEDILEIEVNTENILKDIDTPEDYKRETGL